MYQVKSPTATPFPPVFFFLVFFLNVFFLMFYFFSILLQWRLKKRDEILAGIGDANQILAKALILILSISSVFLFNQFMGRQSS